MSGISSFKCTPRQTAIFAEECIKSSLVPFVTSSPGMGKSSIFKAIANKYNLKLMDHRLSTSDPTDLTGLPSFRDGKAVFTPFENFPTEDVAIPEGYDGWMLFLDEFNSAPKSVQAASYKLILDREVGLHKLHERVVIVCAGNLATDKAIVNQLSTAMQSRLIHIEMELNPKEFLEDIVMGQNWDNRILGYLSYSPEDIMDFRPDHNDKTFCCPRTWEFMNRFVKDKPVTKEKIPLYAGTITSGVAVKFQVFTEIYAQLPNVNEIIKNPTGHIIPSDKQTLFAVTTHLMEHTTVDNFKPISLYVDRFNAEFKILFYRGLMVKKPELKKEDAYRDAMLTLARYLHD